jgi:tetrapyrrole methylase family protein/MazG family protein
MTITILGLGPGDPAHLTRQAWHVLSQAAEVYLRTSRHPTVAGLPTHLTLHSFDHLYETLDDFATIYEAIAEQIVALGRRREGVLYAVPGHPLVGESSVQRILVRAQEERLGVCLVEGLSFVEPVLSMLGIDGLAGLQLADAMDLAASHHPLLDPDRPALIGQLYGRRLASEVKLTLMNSYPDDHPVTLVRAAGSDDGVAVAVPLYELDRGPLLDHLTSLFVPPLSHTGGLPTFQDTVARLRAPDGCPWDREQSHQSLRANLLEEAYEVLAALDAEVDEKLCEELGDLLMQIAMHVQIATEEGAFRFADVIGRIDAKLKRRHPHVFADVAVESTADVLRNWEAIKADERAASDEENVHRSRLDGVPAILPALARAQALGERAARAGFDWPDLEGVLEKVKEEVAELHGVDDRDARARELGDLLFSLVNVARWLAVDAESALRGTCDRFVRRYAEMEQVARARGLTLADLPPAEQDSLWEQAKRRRLGGVLE